MILRKNVLQKIEASYGSAYDFLKALQTKNPNMSKDDMAIIDGLVIIGHNLIELELPLMDDVYRYRSLSQYVLTRLYLFCETSQNEAIEFLVELLEYVYLELNNNE